MIVCEEKKWMGGKRERIILNIILLCNLYYFIGLYVKIKNWDVRWVVKWVSKINKIVFEDAK